MKTIENSYLEQNVKLWFERLSEPERDRGFTRTYYSYPAKFQAKLPRGLIKKFSNEGELIFDPFCGGGTTGLEAMLLGRRFVGYDINPFAIFISRIKTTYIDPMALIECYNDLFKYLGAESQGEKIEILDDEDVNCLGTKISLDINKIYRFIQDEIDVEPIKLFFKLVLIHSIKIIGRRDMEGQTSQRFKQIFDRKARLMIKQMNSLPVNPAYHPCFFLGSNHQVILQDEEVDLVITSPPYFNKDVEYLQLQIQRPSLNKSKRSYVIANILGIDPISKTELCGGKGDSYWNTNLNSLKEIFRVLKPSKLSFFWIGFKSIKYFEKFLNQLENLGFEVQGVIDVTLSNDRTASSRSTHHGKATGMMSQDHLIITRKING